MATVNKKKQRIKYLVGIHTALNTAETNVTEMSEGFYSYRQEKIKQVLATVKELLAEDGIYPAEQ